MCDGLRLSRFFLIKRNWQVVPEQKFKDLLSSTGQVSVERSMLDLELEVQWFNTH